MKSLKKKKKKKIISSRHKGKGGNIFYSEKYGIYTKNMDRGGLNKFNDVLWQWTFFAP